MSKRHWLFSLFTCASLLSPALPANAQALLPYAPKLDPELFEQQGLELTQEAFQLIRFQQYELALPRAELATQLAPEHFEPWFILGTLQLQNDENQAAITSLLQAQSLAPEEAGVMFTLGSAYFLEGNYQESIRQFKAGLDEDPENPSAWFDLGNAYLKSAQNKEALASYREAVEREAEFWPAINNIGLIRYEQGKINDAIAKWEEAIAIDEEQAEPQLAKAVALYTKGEVEEGIQVAIDALVLNPRYSDIDFLIENLWGEKLIQDTQLLLATPTIQELLQELDLPTDDATETETTQVRPSASGQASR